MTAVRLPAAFAFSHPAHAVAFGFGAGLVPYAPGTAGTALGWGLGWALSDLHPGIFFLMVAACFVIGTWACELTGRHLGVADHGAMVWDEVVAFLLIVAIVPHELGWQAAAFVAFRFFDIAKPPPIRHFERRYSGGFGVMLDDVVAALYALLLLAAVKRLFF